ncbi:hypothetical protein Hrd1104_03170 [Halorhabdus sp. CBA1104]|uniref:DUF7520 family protein n=1 Tax=Halorhabdus sp. CBA1104 TaxID=1380432 RepID=UPI0012B39B5D|nr:hypothetical protein [Halorhabdus sp. CBA1104]QGN06394.1 hypothetical protein Hrd1104_03170 [Halorhabdus sp. CBA1104]
MSIRTVNRGRRVVIAIYLVVIAIAGLMGAILGATRPDIVDPVLFGVVSLPASPLGMAAYGMSTVALALGVLLGAVAYVAARFDTHEPGSE